MDKLSTNQICFIDDYLQKIGVNYLDIRFEMADHIASALENTKGDFRQNFLDYIAVHQKSLKKQNKLFVSLAIKKARAYFFKTISKPVVLAVFVVLIVSLNYAIKIVAGNGVHILNFTNYAMIIVPLLYVASDRVAGKFSGPEKLMQALCVFYFLFLVLLLGIEDVIKNEAIINISKRYCAAVFIALVPIVLFATWQYKREVYKKLFIK